LLLDFLVARLREMLEISESDEVLRWMRPVLTQAMLAAVARRDNNSSTIKWMKVVCAAIAILDIRAQESMLGSSPVHRTEAGLWNALEEHATAETGTAAFLAATAAFLDWLRGLFFDTSESRGFRFGLDIPQPTAASAPLAPVHEAARWTLVIEYSKNDDSLSTDEEGGAYSDFDLPSPIESAFATGFHLAFVPVPPSSRFDPSDTSRPSMIYVGIGGDLAESTTTESGVLSISASGDAGILVPAPRLEVTPSGYWIGDWSYRWMSPPVETTIVTGEVELAFRYATARRTRADADPDGVSLTVDRFVTEGRISATGGVGSGPGGAGSNAVASVRMDLEGVTLTLGSIPGMPWLTAQGTRVTFDAGVQATWQVGGTPTFGFRGSVGGELVIPLGETAIGALRFHQVRVKAHVGRTSESTDAGHQMALDVLADVSLRIKSLTLAVDGLGVRLSAGTTEEPNGNLAGIASAGWNPVYPTRIGITVECPSFRGGGFLDHDEESDRWSGGGEFRAWNDKLSVRALFLCEPSLTAGDRSWIALGTLEWPSPAWFIPKGIGVLLASNRTTNPAALLAAVAAGDLEAILFPSDVATRGAAYIATLGRLLPAAADGCVRAIFLTFSGLGGKVRADLGVMYDAGASERAYLLARLRIALPTVDDPLTKIEVAALGVWDRARDEYELRAALINSHIFGGELTGEALMFRGVAKPNSANTGRVFLVSVGGFHPKYVVPGPAIQVPARVSLLVQRGDHLRLECQAYLAITQGTLQLGLESSLVARFAGFGIRGNLGFDALINTSLEFLVSVRVGVALYLGSRMLLGASLEGEIGLVGEGNTAAAYLSGRARISFWFFDYETPRFRIPLLLIDREWSTSRDPGDSLYDAIMENANWDNGGTPGVLVRPPVDRTDWRVSPSAPLRFTQALVPLDVPITHFDSVALPQARTLAIEVDRPVGATWTTAAVEEEFAPMMFFSLTPEEKLAVRGFEYLPGGVELARPLTAGVAIDLGLECEELVIDRSNPPETPRSIVIESEIAVLGRDLGPHRSIFQQGPTRQPASLRAEQFAVLDARGDVVAIDRSFTAAFGHARGQLGHEVVPMREVA
jgi:hypothetical protein